MIQIILAGTSGAMGKHLIEQIGLNPELAICAGVDRNLVSDCPFPQYANFDPTLISGDVIIDFSHPSLVPSLLKFALEKKIPAVICTTGLDEALLKSIADASLSIPIFLSGNMSLGINLLIQLAKTASMVLGEDWDIEIIEKHHRRKLDAPSGTALMIAEGIQSVSDTDHPLNCGRSGREAKRVPGEIGMHAVRGGSIVGDHEVLFAGLDENLTLTHSATSRAVFAKGAIRAAQFLVTCHPGLYNMNDMLKTLTKTILKDSL